MENKIKDWAREKAKEVHRISYTQLDDWHVIEAALLEAYERGKKDAYDLLRSPEMTEAIKQVREIQERDLDDETLLREAFTRLEDFHPSTCEIERNCGMREFLDKLEERLAPRKSHGK